MRVLRGFFIVIVCFSGTQLLAQDSTESNADTVDFPLLDDAKIFYQSNDIEPKIIIYHTQNTFTQVTNFYTQLFTAPVSQQTIYGRLELKYTDSNRNIRIIVDDQENAREVDVMIE